MHHIVQRYQKKDPQVSLFLLYSIPQTTRAFIRTSHAMAWLAALNQEASTAAWLLSSRTRMKWSTSGGKAWFCNVLLLPLRLSAICAWHICSHDRRYVHKKLQSWLRSFRIETWRRHMMSHVMGAAPTERREAHRPCLLHALVDKNGTHFQTVPAVMGDSHVIRACCREQMLTIVTGSLPVLRL